MTHPHRFATGAYAGLAPVDRRSGTSLTTPADPERGPRLKNAVFQAAFVAIRHDPAARVYYDHMKAEGRTALPAARHHRTTREPSPSRLTTRRKHPPHAERATESHLGHATEAPVCSALLW